MRQLVRCTGRRRGCARAAVGGLLALPALLTLVPFLLPPSWYSPGTRWLAGIALGVAAVLALVLLCRATAPSRAAAFRGELRWLVRASAWWVACCLLPTVLTVTVLAIATESRFTDRLSSWTGLTDLLTYPCWATLLTAPLSLTALVLLAPAATRGRAVRLAYILIAGALPAVGILLWLGPYGIALLVLGSPVFLLQALFAAFALPRAHP
jgi:hypothetical protein